MKTLFLVMVSLASISARADLLRNATLSGVYVKKIYLESKSAFSHQFQAHFQNADGEEIGYAGLGNTASNPYFYQALLTAFGNNKAFAGIVTNSDGDITRIELQKSK